MVRSVKNEDIDILFQWQSNPITRQFSRNPHAPSLLEHQEWFKLRINRKDEPFYIITVDSKPVGTIRLDKIRHDFADFEVSILIEPESYGQGIGYLALGLLREKVGNFPILATVYKENIGSVMIFKKAGYKKIGNSAYLSQGIQND